jgi:site-specific DNA recombinase
MTGMNTTTTPTARAAVYVRISDDKTGAGLGVDRQEQDCRRLADTVGLHVRRIYCDNDISAYSGKKRPDYEEMLAAIAAGEIDAVLTWHLDRLHRSTTELDRYIGICENDARSVPTYTVRAGHIDLTTATGRMIARQIGVQARYESELKSERVIAARIQAAKRGAFHGGRRPYGYEADGVTVRPAEAAEIRTMVDAVVSGQSLRSVVRDLNARKVPTARGAGRWLHKTVREMLMRPRIAGLCEYKGQVAGKAAWDAIVDETAWRTVVSILSNPARATADGSRLGRGVSWLGTGLYICGVCDQRTLKVGASSSHSPSRAYRCKNSGVEDDRPHVSRVAVALDDYVEGLVIDYLSKPGRVEKILARDDSVDAAKLRRELVGVESRKDELAVLFADGAVDAGQFAVASKRLTEQGKTLAAKLATVGYRSPLEPLAHGDISALWSGLTLAQKRAVLKTTVDITVESLRGSRRRGEGIDKGVSVRWLVG